MENLGSLLGHFANDEAAAGFWPIISGRTGPEQTDFSVLHQQFHNPPKRRRNGIVRSMIELSPIWCCRILQRSSEPCCRSEGRPVGGHGNPIGDVRHNVYVPALRRQLRNGCRLENGVNKKPLTSIVARQSRSANPTSLVI